MTLIKLFKSSFTSFKNLIDYEKYRNNYDYNKAVYLMSEFDLPGKRFCHAQGGRELCITHSYSCSTSIMTTGTH